MTALGIAASGHNLTKADSAISARPKGAPKDTALSMLAGTTANPALARSCTMWRTPMADEQLVEAVAREIARVTLHDMEGSDPGPLSDERWAEMACDEDRVYLENIARAIIPLVREAERADFLAWLDACAATSLMATAYSLASNMRSGHYEFWLKQRGDWQGTEPPAQPDKDARIAELERHIEWLVPALHVLRGMCRTAGLKIGAAKADELIRETDALKRSTT